MAKKALRRVLFVTGIRSDYDIQLSIIRAARRSKRIEAGVVVVGAHLSPLYGATSRIVDEDAAREGFSIVGRLETLLSSDSRASRVKSLALGLQGLVDVCGSWRPDLLFSAMDREEAMAVALAGAYLGLPVAHLGGGDVTGDGIDDMVRHSVTKLSHLHLTHTPAAAERLRRLGEEPWRVQVVGAPGLDRLADVKKMAREALFRRLSLSFPAEFAIVIQHPEFPVVKEAERPLRCTLDALEDLRLPAVILYPNSDAGSQSLITLIDERARTRPDLCRAYRNLDRADFVNLLRHASVLVGNSSAGIIEAPFLGLPSVTVGPRQDGRDREEGVHRVDATPAALHAALRRAAFDKEYRKRVSGGNRLYGDGKAGEAAAKVLASVVINEKLLKKRVAM